MVCQTLRLDVVSKYAKVAQEQVSYGVEIFRLQ